QAALEVRDQLSAVNEAINRLESLHQQIQTVQKLLDTDEAAGKVTNVSYKPVLEQAKTLDKKVRDFESRIYNTEAQEQYDSIHYLSRFQDRLEGLFRWSPRVTPTRPGRWFSRRWQSCAARQRSTWRSSTTC